MAGSSILTLPPEILAEVALFLHGEHFGRLKLTGSKSFWQNLCQPRVLKQLRFPTEEQSPALGARFIKELKGLNSLSFSYAERDHFFGWFPPTRWGDFPSTLTKLRCEIWLNHSSFAEVGTREPIKISQILPNLEELHLNTTLNQEEVWLSELPSCLRHLRVQEWLVTVPLPNQLLSFSTYKLRSKQADRISFPPKLTRLEVEGSILREDQTASGPFVWMSALPTTMTHLSIGESADLGIAMYWIEKLPRGLKYLHFKYRHQPSVTVSESEASAAWPPSLETLVISDLPLQLWPSLPRSLTSFSHSLHHDIEHNAHILSNNQVYESVWESLPPKLTTLEVSMKTPTALPRRLPSLPLLTSLKLPHNYFRLGTHVSELPNVLPPGLTHLELWDASPDLTVWFPSGLKLLNLANVYLKPELIARLPNTLTNLSILSVSVWCTICDPYTGQPNLFGFPESDQAPEFPDPVPWGSLPQYCLSFPALQSLTLLGKCNLNDEFLKHLPKSLTFLEIEESSFTDAIVAQITYHPLKVLRLGIQSNLTGDCFAFLPRTLQELSIPSKQISDDRCSNLPREMLVFEARNAIHLTRRCLPLLPPILRSFSSDKNDNIVQADLPLFPSNLRSTSSYFINANFCIKSGHVSVCQH
jgi:hypothetical protein